MRRRQMAGVAAAVATITLAVAACAGGGVTGPSQPYDEVRGVSVELSRGQCPDGACTNSVTVSGDRQDGTTAWSDVDGNTGAAAPDATAALFAFVDDSLDDLTAEASTGSCPTAPDGQEVSIAYSQLPTGPDAHLADASFVTSSTCQHVWPDGFTDRLRTHWEATGAPWPLDEAAS